jgi:hypothetical protein
MRSQASASRGTTSRPRPLILCVSAYTLYPRHPTPLRSSQPHPTPGGLPGGHHRGPHPGDGHALPQRLRNPAQPGGRRRGAMGSGSRVWPGRGRAARDGAGRGSGLELDLDVRMTCVRPGPGRASSERGDDTLRRGVPPSTFAAGAGPATARGGGAAAKARWSRSARSSIWSLRTAGLAAALELHAGPR